LRPAGSSVVAALRVRHRCDALAIVVVFSASNLAWGQVVVRAGEQVQVSVEKAELQHSEVIIAADPQDPRRLLACSMLVGKEPAAAARTVAYLSVDGGLSWSSTLEFGGQLWSADPSCAFGSGGAAWYSALVFDSVKGTNRGQTVVYHSSDGGRTWSRLTTFEQQQNADREFLTVEPGTNTVYLAEREIKMSVRGGGDPRLVVYESTDGGKSFAERAIVPSPNTLAIFGYPGGMLSDGTFITSFSEVDPVVGRSSENHTEQNGSPSGKMRVLIYNGQPNGGPRTAAVDELYGCNPLTNSLTIPSLSVDMSTGPFRGRVYLAWADSRSGRCNILFSSSTDGGNAWSKPFAVNDDQQRSRPNAGPDDSHPVVAVNRAGVVGVLWYDRRDNTDNLGWRPRFAASLDGGDTFTASVSFGESGIGLYERQVLELDAVTRGGGDAVFRDGGRLRVTLGYRSQHGLTGGETAGLIADAAGVFHALWIDNRTGKRQVWTTSIRVDAAASRSGADDLPSLEDVSETVTVHFTGVRLDRVSQTLTASAFVENTSQATLCGPLRLKVVHLESKLGVPEFTNADNRQRHGGAVFRLDSVLNGGVLRPGEISTGKRMTIHLSGLPLRIRTGDYDALFQMVTLDFIVLGVRSRSLSCPERN